MNFVSILLDEGDATIFDEKPKISKTIKKSKISSDSPLPFKSILFDNSENFNEFLESENDKIEENNEEVNLKGTIKDTKELISFRQKSEEIKSKMPKIKRKPSKKIIQKPMPKTRNFVKENIVKASIFKKKSLIDEFISEPTPPPPKSKTPDLKEAKLLIPEIKEEIQIKPQPILRNIEEPRPLPVRNLKVTNTDLLALVFQQFADMVVMQWEEAADALIDDLLIEEAEYLNCVESTPKEYSIGKENELIMALESMLEDEIALRNKYLNF